MAPTTSLIDLPVDVLVLILPHLDALSFLNLTSTCKALHQPWLYHDSQYWSALVRTTFRVPNQPVVQNDGQRWQTLYKRMFTQSKVYTWGSNEKACLGHSYRDTGTIRHRHHVSWPGQVQGTDGIGVIADLQCGGWSTTVLTSKGALHSVGVMDGMELDRRRRPYAQQIVKDLTPLRYPAGFVPPHERYDEATAIRSFSSGRAHILAVSDSGRIWSWQNMAHPAVHVKFLHHDTVERKTNSRRGTVHKVVAGWSKSAALIEGAGIVVWEPLKRDSDSAEEGDTMLVMETAVVPQTDEHKSPQASAEEGVVGQVTNFIVFSNMILFTTHLGKLFVALIHWDDDQQSIDEPRELDVSMGAEAETSFATDVQGSHLRFAVFLRTGAVLVGDQDRIFDHLRGTANASPIFTLIPALQNKDVIAVAFGDYHFHALHAQGHITSYGNEPQSCGALGLCGFVDGEYILRGLRRRSHGTDAQLVPHAYTEGRRIWFEKEKQTWLRHLALGGAEPEDAAERIRSTWTRADRNLQGEVSEWVEQQGRDWESKLGLRSVDDDGLGAYFALSVTAAGWHSGALVLVNQELADKMTKACEVPDQPDDTKEIAETDSATPDQTVASEEVASSSPPTTISTTRFEGLIMYLYLILLDYGRWFLGVSPYSAPRPTPSQQQQRPVRIPIGRDRRHYTEEDVRNHMREESRSPRPGVKYVWADDHFPRLILSDGTEMPGTVPFDQWRYLRPEFDLDVSL